MHVSAKTRECCMSRNTKNATNMQLSCLPVVLFLVSDQLVGGKHGTDHKGDVAVVHLMAQREEAASRVPKLRLRQVQAGDDALGPVRDVQEGSLRAEPVGFSIGIRIHIPKKG